MSVSYPIIALFAVLSLWQVALGAKAPSSFAYILQANSLNNDKADAIAELAHCKRDWIILDLDFSEDMPWNREDLDHIRAGKSGRKMIAYISIGEAEDYRPYWRKEWSRNGELTAAAPSWLGTENPDWEGNYRVNYWDSQWQSIILGSIDSAFEQGFDGVYLDIIDGFESFEESDGEYLDNRINPETKQSYRRDMVDWVKTVADRARAKKSDALIIPQNGSQLLANKDYVDTISAIGIEDLFTDGNKLQPKQHTRMVLEYLKVIFTEQKPVLVIEYPKNAKRQAYVTKQTEAYPITLLITDRDLETLGESEK
ncbi:MJ1477/TM1410 family putative glycoside hydrolase [Puniceicoccus vermicola]|uniref:Endo alpha-1,4 polygalactosaminidase n=1 Tax=Puniceicoccus vermicola TaxID=388746 RepID=A0A7X1B280_9BACT|nr:MJ1477/TM1410 family putative glycoside hydrolase [Puniceicoccus vermicola]MBC2604300.1 endo alpha-1,4 polygalactosaminidase [Puniceicoccus vermicola]